MHIPTGNNTTVDFSFWNTCNYEIFLFSPPPTPHYYHQSDEVWMNNCQKLMDLTGDIPLGLYETPIPKVRSLTPSMLKWIAETGRFVFHKDTSLDTQTMLSKMAAVRSVPSTPLK